MQPSRVSAISLQSLWHAASIGIAGAAQAQESMAAAAAWASAAGGARTALSSQSGSERRTARLLQDQTEFWQAEHDEEEHQGETSRQQGGSLRQAASRASHQRKQLERPPRPGLRSTWGIEEEESFWGVQPRYSTHTCIGPKPDDRWQA